MSQRNKIVGKRERWDNGVIGRKRIVISKGRGNANRTYHVKTHYGTSSYRFSKNMSSDEIKEWVEDILTTNNDTEKKINDILRNDEE